MADRNDTPWRDPSRLTADDKARLMHITDAEAQALDPSSDEHELVWGFRTERPEEEHRMRLGWASQAREDWHGQLAAGGHAMTWHLEDGGIGTCAEWQGQCTDCGANVAVFDGGTSCWRFGKDARETSCSGPGSAWQDEMLRERQQDPVTGIVAEFLGALKEAADQAWLHEQGIDPEAE